MWFSIFFRSFSPFSFLTVEDIKDCESEQLEALNKQNKVPGLRSSMSVSDLVNHLEDRISKQGPSDDPTLSSEEWESLQVLEDINRCLFSDIQNMPDSDEKLLMSRVNSLCCLLQKDTGVGSNVQSIESNNFAASTSGNKYEEKYSILHDHESNDIHSHDRSALMSRKDSIGDMLLNLPRIDSLPQFLFNI